MTYFTRKATIALATATFMSAGFAHAQEVDHFEGKPSRTVTEAMKNLEEGNAKLRSLLDGELSPTEMGRVHEVTYTLENALARLAEAREKAAVSLENVHLASERNDVETVRDIGETYIEVSSGFER